MCDVLRKESGREVLGGCGGGRGGLWVFFVKVNGIGSSGVGRSEERRWCVLRRRVEGCVLFFLRGDAVFYWE